MSVSLRTDSEIAAIRESGQMLATVLDKLCKAVEIGVTPKDLSVLAKQELVRLGGEPAFLGFEGYPDVICISVNDQVQHTIPDSRPFEEGDVVNLDFGVRYKNMITDAGRTVGVGQLGADEQRLLQGTHDALEAAIRIIRDGVRVGDVSAAIEAVLSKHKLGIVKELVGHGVGRHLHEDPEIPNYGHPGTGPILRAGMTIAIEPIANLGTADIAVDHDGWTIRTTDGQKSAQFEDSLLVLPKGVEILTRL